MAKPIELGLILEGEDAIKSQNEPKIVSLDKDHQLIYFESTNIELNEFLINDSLNDH